MTLFKNRVKKYLSEALEVADVWYKIESGIVASLIEHCFTFEGPQKKQKAKVILEIFFSLIVRNEKGTFYRFLSEIATKKEESDFLTLILYSLYYNDLHWERLITCKGFHVQLLQWFASIASSKSLQKVWKSLPQDLQKEAQTVCTHYFDEGGFALYCLNTRDSPQIANREACRQGLQKMVFALPTCNKELKKLPWLSSIAEGIREIASILGEKGSSYPIFVFDQSKEPLFKKNAQYIEQLRRKEGVTIFHLNSEQILAIAKKLHAKALIQPSAFDGFGYGGSRNAIFLLGPALLAHVHNGAPLALQEDYVLYMGDDDVYVPVEAIISNALFVQEHIHEYFCRISFVIGRDTQHVVGCLDESLLTRMPQEIILKTSWQKTPFLHGMSGLLCKPKLCLNVPHGQEESFFQAMNVYHGPTDIPLIHLAGRRYPEYAIPVKRMDGFLKFLKKQNTYVLQLLQITQLVTPAMLVWNTRKKPFTSFFEALVFISQPERAKAMQTQFWENFFFFAKNVETYESNSKEVCALQEFCRVLTKAQDKKQALCALKNQSKLFIVTHSLYLLCRSIGLCEFQEALRLLLAQDTS